MDSDNSQGMKVYRPSGKTPWITYIGMGVFLIIAIILGFQNISLRREVDALKNTAGEQVANEKEMVNPETFDLNQQNIIENWRIYKNLTYGYKFRVPKEYGARVNNARNSVEVFNENDEKTLELIAEPKSDTNTGSEAEKHETVGQFDYNIFEFADGTQTIKAPHAVYKTANDKYVFSLYFYNSTELDEVKKLILTTFTQI